MSNASRHGAGWAIGGILVLTVLAGAYVVIYGPMSPFSTEQPILMASQIDEDTLEVRYGCTRGDTSVDIVQRADNVAVRLRARTFQGDCASGYILDLDQPFGDRLLIDSATGESVEVSPRLTPVRP